MVVYLDEVEYQTARYAGELMNHLSLQAGLKDNVKSKRSSVDVNRIGCVSERAVAKALDLYWGGAAWSFKRPDLTHQIEVRTVGNASLGLKVNPHDAADKRVVGVMHLEEGCRLYKIVGWCYAGDAKQKRYMKDPGGRGPVYWMPLHLLRPWEELVQIVSRERGGQR